ncbi:MAG: hypothetical protein ACK5QX_12245 [bacterium]|jgi:hypothetical protein
MTDRATLLALAYSLEHGSGGPRDFLDAEIALVVGYTCEAQGRERIAWWRDAEGNKLGSGWWNNFPPPYTASLDAAVTLYPVLPETIPSCPRKASAAALRARAEMAQPSSDT